ncbi:MAG: IS1595 family transposase [candidate division Zixibacteria bacterium]|nr:IS1595 family transposase [candidate division Zixibacteria bacterium]
MVKLILSEPYFNDAVEARNYLEKVRWPHGTICPHCGYCKNIYKLTGGKTRAGLYKCGDCRKQFTVTVGTLFERSRIPLHKLLLAIYLISVSEKYISSSHLHRMLGITYKTAWFLSHKIKEAIKDPNFLNQYDDDNKTGHGDEDY